MDSLLKVLLFVWELPQNLCGIIFKAIIKIESFGSVKDVTYYVSSQMSGGVTLGEYIFLSESASKRELTRYHEYGHVRQSRYLGWFYLIVIGLPSIIRAGLNLYKDYYNFYTESWADKLGGITRDEEGNRVLAE